MNYKNYYVINKLKRDFNLLKCKFNGRYKILSAFTKVAIKY